MSKRYLVTGAAGFIGSALASRLLKLGHEVTTIDNLSTGVEAHIPAGVKFFKGDCFDEHVIGQLNSVKFDAIIHVAGQSSGEISFDDPVYDLRTNTEATIRLVDYALKTGCRRFIFTSSMSVYGAVEDQPIAETHNCRPLSFYAVGKLASEHYLRIYADRGIRPTILRLFNVYGPGQNLSNLRQGMVSIYLAELLGEGGLIVKGDLDRFRDFIYVDDVVDSIIVCLENDGSIGQTYNVGTGKKTTVATLLSLLKRVSGIDKEIKQLPGTPGDQKGIYGHVGKIQAELGFAAKTGLEDGLTKMVEWAVRQ